MTYRDLLALVDGDHDLIAHLIEDGEIEQRDATVVVVDVDRVLVAKTLVRELEINWPGVGLVLRLLDDLAAARHRIGELENRRT